MGCTLPPGRLARPRWGRGGRERSLRQFAAVAGGLLEAATEIGSVSAARGVTTSPSARRWGAATAPTHSPRAARNSPELHVAHGRVSGQPRVYPCGVFSGAGAEGSRTVSLWSAAWKRRAGA